MADPLEKRKLLQNEMRQIEMRENHPAWQKLRYETVDHSDIEAKKLNRHSDFSCLLNMVAHRLFY